VSKIGGVGRAGVVSFRGGGGGGMAGGGKKLAPTGTNERTDYPLNKGKAKRSCPVFEAGNQNGKRGH